MEVGGGKHEVLRREVRNAWCEVRCESGRKDENDDRNKLSEQLRSDSLNTVR